VIPRACPVELPDPFYKLDQGDRDTTGLPVELPDPFYKLDQGDRDTTGLPRGAS